MLKSRRLETSVSNIETSNDFQRFSCCLEQAIDRNAEPRREVKQEIARFWILFETTVKYYSGLQIQYL